MFKEKSSCKTVGFNLDIGCKLAVYNQTLTVKMTKRGRILLQDEKNEFI